MNFFRLFQSEPPSAVLGGRYQVLKQLGAGGFGQTFLATDLHLPGNPHCIVKRLQPQFSDPTTLQMAKRLFDTEAQVLYALGTHDQIPQLLAHFEQDQSFYLVQELVVGHCLSWEVRDGCMWNEAQVVGLLRDILEVLAFVHQQHVIHRDIKPANLMRRHADGKVVLIDFGAVKQATAQPLNSTSDSALTISIGTPGYMPNEQLAGNPRLSSDVFAVGMIAIHALTSISPRSLPKNFQTGEIEWQQAAKVHPQLAAVLDQMVCYDFRDRYTSAAEALAALSQVPIAPAPPPPLIPPPAQNSDSAATSIASASEVTVLLTNPAASPVSETAPNPRSSEKVTLPMHFKDAHSGSIAKGQPSRQFSRRVRQIWLPAAGVAGVALLVFLIRPMILARTANTQSIATTPNAATVSPDAPDQAATLLTQANQLREQKQFQQALAVYDQAIALDPNLAEAQWGRCYSLNTLEQFQAAIAACDRALQLNSSYAEAMWSKGYALDQQNQQEAALTLYNQAIALKPDFAEAWSNKGATLTKLKRSAEALAAFDKAIALNPNLAEAWSNRGTALWSLRRFQEALSSVERAIEIQPDYPEALNLRQQMRQHLSKGQ